MRRNQALMLLAAFSLPVCRGTNPPKFSGEAALEHTRRIVAFGPRPVGSVAHAQMVRFLEAQLKVHGCRAERDVWTAQTPAGPKTMTNLLVKIAGDSKRMVVLTGHYDTKTIPGITFAGANDGGSSAGVLLELARVLCGTRGKSDIWLAWFDGEEAIRQDWSAEDSLYGSRRMAAQWASNGTARQVKALVNLDMIGDRDLNLLEDLNSSSELRETIRTAARELRVEQYFTRVQSAVEDDHIPFARIGIPVLDLIDLSYGPGNSYWHTDRDTVDKLSARSFQVVGDVVLRAIGKLGGTGQ